MSKQIEQLLERKIRPVVNAADRKLHHNYRLVTNRVCQNCSHCRFDGKLHQCIQDATMSFYVALNGTCKVHVFSTYPGMLNMNLSDDRKEVLGYEVVEGGIIRYHEA